jgi:surface protein
MFENCSSLTSLDVSNFNTSNMKNMSYMFQGCSSLQTIYAGNWKISWEGVLLFNGCKNLVGGKGTRIEDSWQYYGEDGWNHSPFIYDGNLAHIDGGKDNPGLFTAK